METLEWRTTQQNHILFISQIIQLFSCLISSQHPYFIFKIKLVISLNLNLYRNLISLRKDREKDCQYQYKVKTYRVHRSGFKTDGSETSHREKSSAYQVCTLYQVLCGTDLVWTSIIFPGKEISRTTYQLRFG